VAEVLVSSVIEAPVEVAWQTVRRFDAAAEFLPFVETSPIEAGREPTAVGAIRVVTQADGGVFREVLVAHSDADHFYAYTFVGAPIPVRNHRTTLGLREITDGGVTLAEWSSRFEIAHEHEAELVGLMETNFLAGLRALSSQLAGS
jgi:hypothetical protein